MANEESIDNLLSPKAFKQLEKLDEQLLKSQARLIDCAEAAAMFNNSLASAKTAKEFSDSQKKMAIENEKLRQQLAKTDAEQLKVAALKQKAIDREIAARAKEEAALNKKAAAEAKANKETLAAAGSVDQLRAKLTRLTAAYNALSKSERENADIGGVQLKNIQELDREIKGVAESTGNFRDSVGNYAKGLSGPLAGVVQGLESVGGAMVALPFALVAAGLYGMYKAFLLNDDAANRIKGTFLGLETVASNAANSFVEFFNSTKESDTVGDALSIIGEGLLKIIPGADAARFAINKFLEANKDIIDVANQYVIGMDAIEFSTNKSSVAISENELAIQRLATTSRDVTKAGKERLAALDQQSQLEAKNASVSIALTDQKLFLERKLLASQKAGSTQAEETEFRIFELQVERNNRLKEQEELETSQQKRRASLAKEIAAEEKKIIDDLFNLQKQRLEFQRYAQTRLADDTTQSLETRLTAESAYYDKQAALLSLSLNHDLKEVDLSSTKRKQIQEKYANDTQLLEVQRVAAINKIAMDSFREAESDYDKHLKTLRDQKKQSDKNQLLEIETARDNELAAVTDNTEEAALKRIQIEKKYTLEYIAEQIKQTEAAIEYNRLRNIDTTEQEAQLAALRRKNEEARRSDAAKTAEFEKKTTKEKIESEIAAFSALSSQISELSNLYFSAKFAALDKEKTEQERVYDEQKSNIENSTDSEERKRARLEALDRRDAARKKELADKENKLRIQQAKIQRAIQVATIIATTAQAVLYQLGAGDPYTAFGRSIAAGIIGAAQLAVVLATPLPAYEKGGIKSGDGLALVGEKGTEMYVTPTGEIGLTPDKPTVSYLTHGTKIYSNPDLKKMIASGSIYDVTSTARSVNFDVDKLVKAGNANTNTLKKAMSGRRENHTSITEKGLSNVFYNNGSRTRYLNANLKKR